MNHDHIENSMLLSTAGGDRYFGWPSKDHCPHFGPMEDDQGYISLYDWRVFIWRIIQQNSPSGPMMGVNAFFAPFLGEGPGDVIAVKAASIVTLGQNPKLLKDIKKLLDDAVAGEVRERSGIELSHTGVLSARRN